MGNINPAQDFERAYFGNEESTSVDAIRLDFNVGQRITWRDNAGSLFFVEK